MPKRQFLFCAIFGFRNPTQEIFSELDEIDAQGLIFPRSFQKTKEYTKWGDEAPTPQGRVAWVGPAPPYGVGPSSALRLCLFAYLSLLDLKPRDEKATVRETFQSRRHREAKIWGTRVSVPARRRDGEVPPRKASPPPSSPPSLSP